MSRRRMQGSANEGDASPEEGAETESAGEGSTPETAPDPEPAQGDPRGEHKPLGNPRGVRIMFNACMRDEHGTVTRPGERTVTEDEALAYVKQGVATLL